MTLADYNSVVEQNQRLTQNNARAEDMRKNLQIEFEKALNKHEEQLDKEYDQRNKLISEK